MKSSEKNSRSLFSAIVAASIVFAGAGAGRAGELWVASGTDTLGNPALVDINVTITTGQIQSTISDLSPPYAEGTSDYVIQCNLPINDAVITGTGVTAYWNPVFLDPYTLMLTAVNNGTTGGYDTILPGQSATVTLSGLQSGTEPEVIKISKGDPPNPKEIVAAQTPEPSSLLLAASGALGILGYSLCRRMAR